MILKILIIVSMVLLAIIFHIIAYGIGYMKGSDESFEKFNDICKKYFEEPELEKENNKEKDKEK